MLWLQVTLPAAGVCPERKGQEVSFSGPMSSPAVRKAMGMQEGNHAGDCGFQLQHKCDSDENLGISTVPVAYLKAILFFPHQESHQNNKAVYVFIGLHAEM